MPEESAPRGVRLSGPWSWPQVADYLRSTAIPVRLATVGQRGPLVQSMWFSFSDASLWCATQADSLLVRRLRRDARAGFEVAADSPPYRGVRGRATAQVEVERAAEVLDELISRYLDGTDGSLAHWLRSRVSSEVAVRLTPSTVYSWDFAERMGARPTLG